MRRTIGAHPWLVLGLLTAFWGLVGLNRLGITYLFPIIVPEFHMSKLEAGALISGTSATWAITSWLSGWLADRYGRRRVLIPGAAVAVAATASMGATGGFLSMLVAREVVGIGDGVGWPNAQAVLAEEFPPKRRALVHSIFTSGYAFFGSVLGALIVTNLAEAVGWRPVFPIIAVVFAFVVVGMYFFVREPPKAVAPVTTGGGAPPKEEVGKATWADAFKVVRNPTVILLMIVQIGALGWLQVGIGFNSLFLTKVHGMTLPGAGSVLAISGMAGLIGTLTLPSLSDFLGRKVTLTTAGLVSGAFMITYALGGPTLSPLVTTVLLCGSGFFQGAMIPLAAATCVVENVPARVQATAMGAVNFAGVVGGTFIMPLVGGALADSSLGLTAPIVLAGGCMAVAGLVSVAVKETSPRVLARRGVIPASAVSQP